MRRAMTVVVLAAMVSLFPIAPVRAADTTVNLTEDNTFAPSSVSIDEGDTVTFVWEGGFHNVVFDDGESSGEPVGTAGTEYSRTFDAAGTYRFVCEVHVPGMAGTVTVGSAGGADEDQGDGADDPSYPPTGPESSLLPALGGLLLASAGIWSLARRRRTGRRT